MRLSGNRLHLQNGPIDLIVKARGRPAAVEEAYTRATHRFQTILSELVSELELLRRQTHQTMPCGTVARRMWTATQCFDLYFVTPMIAVAGSVADEIGSTMASVVGLDSWYVNNGGDIALGFNHNDEFRVGIMPLDGLRRGAIGVITRESGIGGVATSGWRGRSHSLGIADSVTVLAETAAMADAAATLIANAVDVDVPQVERAPAVDIDPDSDLGDRMVTLDVGVLDATLRAVALGRGEAVAAGFVDRGLVIGAYLYLQGKSTSVARGQNQFARKRTPTALGHHSVGARLRANKVFGLDRTNDLPSP